MKTKQFILTAIAVFTLVTAAFSGILSNDETTLKCYDNTFFKSADSTGNTGNDDGSNGGGIIPPIGH